MSVPPQGRGAPPADTLSQDRPPTRGAAPRGTLAVVLTLLLSILGLWMLVLGVLQGRA
ncbi:hypothetical protein [Deinococcus sp.]|uniref:hypothetical protein n=1 Tax=Deinococcus sp. TaxID=47478 RepID=UPI0025C57830|nr:hypothetical protein [Deinococcus sp.]